MNIKRVLFIWFITFFDETTSGGAIKKEIMSNKELAEEIHKPNITKQKIHPSFIGKIWGAHLADMQLINKSNEGICFLLCVIAIFSKYAGVIPLKDKKSTTITDTFQIILDESNRKPNETLVDKGSEFCNRSIKSWPDKIDIEMYSTHNEGKSIVAVRFVRTLKNEIYKYVTSISKNVYINKLDDIVKKCNSTYHRTIKIKPVDARTNKYIDFNKENNKEGPNLKLVMMQEYQNEKIFLQKGYVPNWPQKVLVKSYFF